jgi:taurine transport system permease protein
MKFKLNKFKHMSNGLIISFLSVFIFLLAWDLTGRLKLVNPVILPPPSDIWDSAVEIFTKGYRHRPLWYHLGSSVGRALAAFFLAIITGLPLGLAMGLLPKLSSILDPFIQFFRPVPKLALIPLVILWLGIGEVSKIFLIYVSALLTLMVGCSASVKGVSQNKLRLGQALGANKWQILLHFVLPSALPDIFTSTRLAFGVGWTTLIASEMVAADSGLGWMVLNASSYMRTDIVILGIIFLGLTGYFLDFILVMLQKLMVPWAGKN